MFTDGCGCTVQLVLVYYAAGSFPVWYVQLRGTCTVGRSFFPMRVLALPRAYCVICTMYVAACSVRVLVYSALLYVATASWLRPCWEKFIGSPKLGWVIVILSIGRVLLGMGSWIIFMAFGVAAGHQRFCWGLCWNRHLSGCCRDLYTTRARACI